MRIYKLLSEMSHPESGPRVPADSLVYVLEWCGDSALVKSCEDFDDPCPGCCCSEPTRNQGIGWVSVEDLEPTE